MIFGKILCLEMRCWNSTWLDTNLNFLFSFVSDSIDCLWYLIFVVLHLWFIFKILWPKLCSESSLWCACSSEFDVPVPTFFVAQTVGRCVHSIISMKLLESKLLNCFFKCSMCSRMSAVVAGVISDISVRYMCKECMHFVSWSQLHQCCY
jgi:hypothetical protein